MWPPRGKQGLGSPNSLQKSPHTLFSCDLRSLVKAQRVSDWGLRGTPDTPPDPLLGLVKSLDLRRHDMCHKALLPLRRECNTQPCSRSEVPL